ncbi:MAG TPA: YgaP-like transmembrane domain [Vicinamibacterales bacterium]|nr:YgaP-like transmembrane domain [Vicinamibacterales bacterium]
MITVYGADWCEDTRRSRRHLRRLGVVHRYFNIDEDAGALERAKALNYGARRTPTIDLGVGGSALVEPDNDTLTGALVELEMLTREDVKARLAIQNVGDTERAIRAAVGMALVLAGSGAPRALKWPLRIGGAVTALSGLSGWCPGYHAARVTSINGPGDHPDEAERATWLTAR